MLNRLLNLLPDALTKNQPKMNAAGRNEVGLSNTIDIQLQLKRANFHLDVHIELPNHGVTAIFGHSGSGKTSLLRCIAGLEPGALGSLYVGGRAWQHSHLVLPTYQRPLGFVFQEASLFAHLTAQGNLQFAMDRADHTPNANVTYEAAISLLGIQNLLNRYPHQLSGGERQRVAIARVLLIQPALLLMDEPLSSLDEPRRQEVLPYLEKLKTELKLPILYVTHSANEVARLADHIVTLEHGKVTASGPIKETLSSLDFPIPLGDDVGVILDGQVIAEDPQMHLSQVLISTSLNLSLWVRQTDLRLGQSARIRVLARDVSLTLEQPNQTSILNIIRGEIISIGSDHDMAMVLIQILIDEQIVLARITKRSLSILELKPQDRVFVQIKSAAIVR